MAETGKQLKQSVNVFQILMLYLLLPEPEIFAENTTYSISIYSPNYCSQMLGDGAGVCLKHSIKK